MVLPALGAIGGFASGIGSLAGSLFGGGGSQQPIDYASLYALQLAPGQTQLTSLAQENAALLGPYLAALNTETGLQAALALGQFNQGAFANEKAISTQAAITQALGAAGVADQANKATARNQIQALGPSSKAGLADTYSRSASSLATGLLTEEGKSITELTRGLSAQGLGASQVRNEYAKSMGDMAMYKVKSEIDTQKYLNQLRGQTESEFAKKRWGAGMALSGATGWS